MHSWDQSRCWSAICLMALLAFFTLATHAHLDDHNDIRCPTCQAGGLHLDLVDADVKLAGPEVSTTVAIVLEEGNENPFCAGQHTPRAPPAESPSL